VGQSTEFTPEVDVPVTTPAHPVWFGPEDARLFGFFHQAAAPARDCAVILCNPFGYDAVLSHCSYRHLAERLAAGGIATLRFDYYGTGDSSGGDDASNRLDAWLRSIENACEEVRLRSGATAIALFGLRLGGLLATVAAQRAPVHDLILLGPPVSGRVYLRELRALRAMQTPVNSLAKIEDHDSEDDNFGFLMTAPMRKALEAIDPRKITIRPARRALVIPRDDGLRSEGPLVDHLLACGVEATVSTVSGYSLALRGDPYTSDLPDEAWSDIVVWLQQGHAVLKGNGDALQPPLSRSYRNVAKIGTVREEAVHFRGLFGLLTEPIEQSTRAGTAIILIDSGANHRIGNNRMYVTWARAWADLGFRVLRFDLAGIGDSPVEPGRREKEVYSPRAMFETQAAIDFMEDRGCRRFVLGGLCSGAYVAFHCAVADSRIAGIMLMNPPTFHWEEGDSLELRTRNMFGSTSAYARAAISLATWRRALHGEIHIPAIAAELGARAIAAGRSVIEDVALRAGVIDEPNDIARGFKSICARGTDTLLVYGPDDGGIDVLERHLGPNARKMRGEKHFQMKVVEGADHTFTKRPARERLRETLTQHLIARFS